MRWWAVACVAALGACKSGTTEHPEPPVVDTQLQATQTDSTLIVPVSLSLDTIERSLERSTPRKLWSIDERRKNCVPPQRVKVFGRKVRVSPDISCRIVGRVNRGKLRLTGKGRRLTIVMPVSARISAKDVGGVLKGETADGSATVRADVDLDLDRDWNPRAKVNISYGWREPPGIDFLGQRIGFVSRADKELAGVIRGLERDLQREIARQHVRPIIADAWKQGFAVVSLNEKNPPVWMRIVPTGIGVAGFGVSGRTVRLRAAAAARTETFVGAQPPEMPTPTALPVQMKSAPEPGLRFSIPVLADYAELEPVVLRELRKLSEKGIVIEGLGTVEADFKAVTVRATELGRIAVGIEAEVEPVGERFGTRFGKAKGKVWLTGLPVNEANSQVVSIKDLQIYGGADKMATDLLIRLLETETVRERIEAGLTEDFGKDYARIVEAAKSAIAERRAGDFDVRVTIDEVTHDRILVTGKGLYLPVQVRGQGRIVYSGR
jgi:hypothetical protein